MMLPFTYDPAPQRVVFGNGKLSAIASEVDRLERHDALGTDKRKADEQNSTVTPTQRRVLVVTTKGGAHLGARVKGLLGERCVGVCDDAEMHTPITATERAMKVLEEYKADTIVAIGGGSAIGLAKALALRTWLPQIVIPTTYSGSEATSTIGQTENGRKTTSKHPSVLAKTIIYDPDLTKTLSEPLKLTSGMNAIAHAVEAIYARNSNPITDQLAIAGIMQMRSALFQRFGNGPGDGLADALAAAWLCGSCLANVEMGLQHKLAHTFGGQLGTPHSETHAILLPYTLLYNFSECSSRAMDLFESNFIEGYDPQEEMDDACEVLVARYLWDILHITKEPQWPTSLEQLGVKESDLDAIVETVVTGAPYPNPAALERKRLRKMLKLAWTGERPEVPL